MNTRENKIKKLYNTSKRAWPQDNLWHNYTFNCISNFIIKELSISTDKNLILNAGSGGTEYKIKGHIIHVDIADNLIKDKENYMVASVEQLPFKDNLFDYSICVGSVINYCNAMSAISELSRTLKRGGKLILEFERSESGQFIFTRKHNKPIFPQNYLYNEQNHLLWMYSENYIKDLLSLYDLEIIKVKRFHIISSFACRYDKLAREHILYKLIQADKFFKFISKLIAHNAIIVCKKK